MSRFFPNRWMWSIMKSYLCSGACRLVTYLQRMARFWLQGASRVIMTFRFTRSFHISNDWHSLRVLSMFLWFWFFTSKLWLPFMSIFRKNGMSKLLMMFFANRSCQFLASFDQTTFLLTRFHFTYNMA